MLLFLIEAEGRRILLDMGNGSLTELQKDVDLAALDLIAISHLHFMIISETCSARNISFESRRACGEAIPGYLCSRRAFRRGHGPSCAPTMCLSRML